MPTTGRESRPGLTQLLSRWVGAATVPLAFAGNVACYLGSLVVLEQTRAQHTGQTDDWRLVTVVFLIGWQAAWLHWLRRQALGTFVASLALWSVAMLVGGFDPLAIQPGVLLAVFSYAAERKGPGRVVGVACGIVATTGVLLAAHALYHPAATPGWRTPVVVAAWTVTAVGLVGAPAAAGAWYAQLRDRAERIAALAHAAASGEAVRTAEAVAAERRTLAQELHDTSSAHLAAILALGATARTTGAGAELVEQMRDEGQKLYAGFETMITRMLAEDRTVTDTPRPSYGQHTVTELVDLAAEHRLVTGVPVTVRHEPGLAEIDHRLGPMRSHTAYRVLQEALSNARKHAPGAAVTITVEDDGDSLLLRIENEATDDTLPGRATGSRGPSLGYGLDGMRDRLTAAGGSLRTGPRYGGGWAVNALLPHPPQRGPAATPGPRHAAAADDEAEHTAAHPETQGAIP